MISVVAPEKIIPVEPIVLLVNVSLPARVASVPVVGSVSVVVPVEVKVTSFAPEKAMVVAFGIVSVPVVSVTVNPATLSALNA